MKDRVLIIGGGGREHVLAWKLAHSDLIQHVFVCPGNAGTDAVGKISNVKAPISDFELLSQWCKSESITTVVVGPEDPLANGISDVLNSSGIPCFGPSSAAAKIESSKEFSKSFMERHSLPTAKWSSFTEADKAIKFIHEADFPALVVKCSGLAAGKGVIVSRTKEEACQAVNMIINDRKFGAAGECIIVEELLEGPEISCLCFTDGIRVKCLPVAQDYKTLLDGNAGPNTGGMGAIAPSPLVSEECAKYIQHNIIQKTIDGLRSENCEYRGILYAGLILTKDGPKILEFNCRFGDPEAQVLLPLLDCDLYPIIKSCITGSLKPESVSYRADTKAVAVVMVSGGYPGSYKKLLPITGLENVPTDDHRLVFHAGTCIKSGVMLTNGGRVLSTVSLDSTLSNAAKKSLTFASQINFEDSFFRTDIGVTKFTSNDYASAGVSIENADSLVNKIKSYTRATRRPGSDADIGQFGGLFDLSATSYKDPLLVSGTDGVGTKLKIANAINKHDSIGIDLVAMCVNDVLAHGAEPLFFLDYFACGKLDNNQAAEVIMGVAKGCQTAGCALIGGETAEMPGMYSLGDYDLAGFTVGAVERSQVLPRFDEIEEGDHLIGVSSSGLHSNGFSLVRKIVDSLGLSYKDACPWSSTQTLGEALLEPTLIYSKQLLPALKSGSLLALAHITGGGITGNVVRILPPSLSCQIDATNWRVPDVFKWLAQQGNISSTEMGRTFNCGLGLVLIVKPSKSQALIDQINSTSLSCSLIGSVTNTHGDGPRVCIKNLSEAMHSSQLLKNVSADVRAESREPVAVLISGSGTNLQALIDFSKRPQCSYKIVLVISNKPNVYGLVRAADANIKTKVIKHTNFSSREEFDDAVNVELESKGVKYVCLAGFMRILSGKFVNKWRGKMLNIHPSLLPLFKGANAHKLVLEARVLITGCTVHFVAEEIDSGAIVRQLSVPVLPDDTESSLAERVKTVEHRAFPEALELVTSRKCQLNSNENSIIWN